MLSRIRGCFVIGALFVSLNAFSMNCYQALATALGLCAHCKFDAGERMDQDFEDLAQKILPPKLKLQGITPGRFLRSVFESHPNKDDEIYTYFQGSLWNFNHSTKQGLTKFLAAKFKEALATKNIESPEAMRVATDKMHDALSQVAFSMTHLDAAEFETYKELRSQLAADGRLYIKKSTTDLNQSNVLSELNSQLGDKGFSDFLRHYNSLSDKDKKSVKQVLHFIARDESIVKNSKTSENLIADLLKIEEKWILDSKTLEPEITNAIEKLVVGKKSEESLRRDLTDLVLVGKLKIEIYPGYEPFNRKPELSFGPPPTMIFHEGTVLPEDVLFLMVRTARHIDNSVISRRGPLVGHDPFYNRQRLKTLSSLLSNSNPDHVLSPEYARAMDQLVQSVVKSEYIHPEYTRTRQDLQQLALSRTRLFKVTIIENTRSLAKTLRSEISKETGGREDLTNYILRKRLENHINEQLSAPFPFDHSSSPNDNRLPRVWHSAAETAANTWVKDLLDELTPQ